MLDSSVLVALDRLDWQQSIALAILLKGHVRGFKVHSLIDRYGLEKVKELSDYGELFADMKVKDIPATAADRVSVYNSPSVDYVSVHASGGVEMMHAAKQAAGDTKVLAITVLTSLDDADCFDNYGAPVQAKVLRFARNAQIAGVDGIVCSGLELGFLKGRIGTDTLIRVVPGIRLVDGDSHDQKRVMSPGRAMKAGANRLVIGRLFTQSDDPVAMAQKVAFDILKVRNGVV